MDIQTLDKALSISDKIDQLNDIKKRIQESPSAMDAIRNQFAASLEVLPGDDALTALSAATTEFNNKWVKHLDEQIVVLQAEFDSL